MTVGLCRTGPAEVCLEATASRERVKNYAIDR